MFHLGKTVQLSTATAVRNFHTSKAVFLFGSGAIKVNEHVRFFVFERKSMFFQEGATLPNHTLFENEPKNKVNTKDLFAGKKGRKLNLK